MKQTGFLDRGGFRGVNAGHGREREKGRGEEKRRREILCIAAFLRSQRLQML